jgi:tetratricopeptide (TPR) repeat protein
MTVSDKDRATLPLALLLAAGLLVGSGCRQRDRPSADSPGVAAEVAPVAGSPDYVGSKSCRECHAEFYALWSTSNHGLAMQPYTAPLAQANLTPQAADVAIGKSRYRAEIGPGEGRVREIAPDGEKTFPIAQVMGGKNVYYFLTPLERGRLQVLPVAYDVHKKAWYDTTAGGVRHFADRRDEALAWTDRLYTFNTTCFNCHVSQLQTRYDLASDTYHTTWDEPGISCEACHGPARDHVLAMKAQAAKRGDDGAAKDVGDLRILRSKDLSAAQTNDMCAACHAKLVPLSLEFRPGEKFFDHFDLVVLDHPDYYPDGRDLGENYTHTSWLMSPCLKSGKLDCNHCHTPSGRPRHQGAQRNRACAPCHANHVDNPAAHGHHKAGGEGNDCVGCHMPMTRFAAMNRTDHSMRPPTPATTPAMKSPNACNACHADKDAAWSDGWVRKWYPRDYQAPVLRRAELLDAARKQQWKRLPEMTAAATSPATDVVYRASLVRLLRSCPDDAKWPALFAAMDDASPLVRSSAASALGDRLTPDAVKRLLAATRDAARLVRIRAATSLAPLRPEEIRDRADRESYVAAEAEFRRAMNARPDDWASYANLGAFAMQREDFPRAAEQFGIAHRIEPRVVGPMVNASIAYSNMNRPDDAERSLRRALAVEPANAAANFNLGLLFGEQGKNDLAEAALRLALKTDPQMAPAAYNLAVLVAKKSLDEAIALCRKAAEIQPGEPKFAYAAATYLRQKGDSDEAIKTLRALTASHPRHADAYLLLAAIYEDRKDFASAAAIYARAIAQKDLPEPLRKHLQGQLDALKRK